MAEPEFKYRLEPLLEQREQAKEEAARQLAEKQKALREESKKLERLRSQKIRLTDKVKAQRKSLVGPQTSQGREILDRVERVRLLAQDLQQLKEDIIAQEFRLEQCQDEVSEARTALADASRELEVLNKHKAKLKESFLRELARKDQLEQDELGSLMFATKKRGTQ